MTGGRKPIFLKQIWHRLVGVRGSTPSATTAALPTSNPTTNQTTTSSSSSNFGKIATCRDIADHRLVFLGEIHSMPPITAFQRQVQAEMLNQQKLTEGTPKVHVVMEHFSFELQDILDDYMDGKLDFDEFVIKYKELGEEGHDLMAYKDLLEDAKSSMGMVQVHAGFLPRKYARMWMKEGPEETRKVASQWLPSMEDWKDGTEFHYNVFESFFTGRSIYNKELSPSDQFRRIFQAQVLKDEAMANKINQLIKESGDDEKLLVIAGNGHLKHYCGVPERVLDKFPELASESCLVISESSTEELDDDESIMKTLRARFSEEGPYPADYVYFYRFPEEEDDDAATMDELLAAKEETKRAYDKVGESAALPGNMAKAAWIMYNMGYTEEQFLVAGPDAYNFQGVGNPHIHANIKPGEFVVDVGSGLGVDSFIALHATGSSGRVIGIDLSANEVKHAQGRAVERQANNLEFIEADMEKIPLPDDSVDVIISNGAFCLAPNKEKAFRELYRILKPGGRISVCTTTIQQEGGKLEPGVDWPLCMKMFISKNELQPICEGIGFINVLVDDSDSSMTMEIPEEVLKDSNPNRNRVHVGGDEFKHLENFDMDKICARVCVVATKPIPEDE